MLRTFLVWATIGLVPAIASAQQRPLQTEDPEVIGTGRILVEAGIDYRRDVYVPESGLRGNWFAVPQMGVSIGVGSIAEIQIDGGFYQRMYITERVPTAPFAPLLEIDGDMTSDVEDLNVGAKIRIVTESTGRPAMALRFSTRLPNAGNESGLGKDTQDFTAGFLIAKTVQSVRVVANAGLLILGSPVVPAAQDDMMTYSMSLARALTGSTEMVVEFVGRANFVEHPSPGAEDRGLFRFGARYTKGGMRLDAGVLLGITSRDPEYGFTGGFTYVFNAFRAP